MTLFELWYIGMILLVLSQQCVIFYLVHKINNKEENYTIKIVHDNQE
jgi:hypothetical protein